MSFSSDHLWCRASAYDLTAVLLDGDTGKACHMLHAYGLQSCFPCDHVAPWCFFGRPFCNHVLHVAWGCCAALLLVSTCLLCKVPKLLRPALPMDATCGVAGCSEVWCCGFCPRCSRCIARFRVVSDPGGVSSRSRWATAVCALHVPRNHASRLLSPGALCRGHPLMQLVCLQAPAVLAACPGMNLWWTCGALCCCFRARLSCWWLVVGVEVFASAACELTSASKIDASSACRQRGVRWTA